MRQEIWKWLVSNFVNIFSVFGVFATLYFGLFYVPDYIHESQNEKLNNSTKEVVQSVKELIYSDSIVTVNEINSLIASKEISANIKFPNSAKWFLLKTEESFMEDKFIPLKERRTLTFEIETLISKLPAETITETKKSESSYSSWLPRTISIIATLIGLIIGFISARANYLTRKIKDEEIENDLKEAHTEISATRVSVDYLKIEKSILSILKSLKYEINQHSIENTDSEFDFQFFQNNISYFVEVKVLRASNVGLKSIETFILKLREKRGVGFFIYNTELTAMSASRIRDNNKINRQGQIYPIKFTTTDEVESKIKQIVDSTAANIGIAASGAGR